MNKFSFIKTKNHSERNYIDRSLRTHNQNFEDLMDTISDHWETKAQRLQTRRWRKIRHQLS